MVDLVYYTLQNIYIFYVCWCS